jgi:hypothetical protein
MADSRELFPENANRLGQVSKKYLLALKQEAAPDALYALQLATFGLKSERLMPVIRNHRDQTEELALQLMDWTGDDREAALTYLMPGKEEEDSMEEAQDGLADRLEAMTLEEASVELAGDLWSGLSQAFPRLEGLTAEN